jgi:hypothetical protein
MLKTVLAGATALAIAGSALAYAQPSPGPGGPDHAKRWRPSAEDVAAYGDARLAALKAGLKLSAEQEKNWPAVEAAYKDVSKQRSERFAARASADKPKSPIDRMAARGENMESRGAALKKFADAAKPLYDSLDEGQKRRFMVLARLGVRDGHHWRGHKHARHHEHGRHRDHGPRGPEQGPRPQ